MIVDISMHGQSTIYCDIAPEDTSMVVDYNIEIGDTVLFVCLRYVMLPWLFGYLLVYACKGLIWDGISLFQVSYERSPKFYGYASFYT